MKFDRVSCIKFGYHLIPVSTDDDGIERVALKKICEMIKVDWRAQKRKLRRSPHIRNLLGVTLGVHSTPQCKGQMRRKKVWLINLDKVYVFFNTLNLNQLLAQGNEDAVFFLLRERRKWQLCVTEYRKNSGRRPPDPAEQPSLNLDT